MRKGHIFVCGDAKNMAKDVHEVLIDIILWGFHNDNTNACGEKFKREDATFYLQAIEEDNRYKRDIWT